MQSLEESKGVDKQLYGVTFPSFCISVISLVPSISLWFSFQCCFQKCWALVTSLCCALFITLSTSRSEQTEDRDKKRWIHPFFCLCPPRIKVLQIRVEGSSQSFVTVNCWHGRCPHCQYHRISLRMQQERMQTIVLSGDYPHFLWTVRDLPNPWSKLEGSLELSLYMP